MLPAPQVSTRAGTTTCQAAVTVTQAAPVAKCTAALALPATASCTATPTTAALLAAVDAGSTGGPVVLSPVAPATGVYSLPLGTFPITLSVTNCAGTATCSTLVTVQDEEPLDVSCYLSLVTQTYSLYEPIVPYNMY